jgi:hypothetical protein
MKKESRILARTLAVLGCLSGPVLAQQPAQPACKGYYVIGEVVPAFCAQQTINSSNFTTWGAGREAKEPAPSLFDTRYGAGLAGRRF